MLKAITITISIIMVIAGMALLRPLRPGAQGSSEIAPQCLQGRNRGQRRRLGAQNPRSETNGQEAGVFCGGALMRRETTLGPDQQRDAGTGRAGRGDPSIELPARSFGPPGASGASSSRVAELVCVDSHSSSPDSGRIRGRRLRPHCSHADITMLRQCSSLRSARSPDSRTTERSLMTGTIALAPSSVAFWMVRSIRSPLETHCARVMASGDSRSASRHSLTLTVVPPRPRRIRTARNSPPPPLNSVTSSPSRSRSTATWRAARSGSVISAPGASAPTWYRRGADRLGLPGCVLRLGSVEWPGLLMVVAILP